MGPFETMHLNADGIKDYCMKYGANIHAVCNSQCSSRPLSGLTLDVVKEAMEKKIPVEQLNARRKWRDSRLAALAIHQKDMTWAGVLKYIVTCVCYVCSYHAPYYCSDIVAQ